MFFSLPGSICGNAPPSAHPQPRAPPTPFPRRRPWRASPHRIPPPAPPGSRRPSSSARLHALTGGPGGADSHRQPALPLCAGSPLHCGGGGLLAELEEVGVACEDEEDAGVRLLREPGGDLLPAVVEALHDTLVRSLLPLAQLRRPSRNAAHHAHARASHTKSYRKEAK